MPQTGHVRQGESLRAGSAPALKVNRTRVGPALALVVVLVAAPACASATTSTTPDADRATSTVSAGPAPSGAAGRATTPQPTTEGSTVTTIKITLAGQTHRAQLSDNPTAHDLVDQLPLTLAFRDFNGVEKIAKLPRPLTTNGAPGGADPEANDIVYYAPSGDLVFYYGDVGYWNGIIRIGRFDDDIDFIQRQPDGFEVTIEQG